MRRLTLVVVLALALIASLVWLAGSQSSLQWALGRVVQASHGRLHFEGVRGSLFGAVEIARTRFSSPELEVSVEKCSLHFSLLPLLLGQDLVIDRVAAESVMLRQTPSDEPIVAPTDLTLPLAIQLRSLEVRRLSVQWGESITPLSNVRAQLASDGKQHQITLHQVESPWATASASLQLRGVAPFALDGTARLTPVEGSRLPAANITVGGTLLELKAEIRAQASWLSAAGSGHAQPFAPSPLQSFSAEIERLDLRSIDSSLPHAELKGSIRVHTDAEKRLSGELTLANETAGPLSADKLPLRHAESRFSTDYTQLHLGKLALQLTRGAPLTGEATLSREGLIAELATRGLDLSAWHATLKPTQLSGNLALKLDRTTQDLKAQLADRRYRYDVHLAREGERVQIRRALVRADSASITAKGQVELTQTFPFKGQIQLTELDPAAFGNFPAARLNGSAEAAGWLKPEWQARITLELSRSTWRGQPLSGHIASTFTGERFWDSRGELLLGRNEARFRGALGASEDRLDVEFKLASLEQIVPQWRGSTRGHARLAGKWRYPSLEIEATGEKLNGPQEIRINALQLRAVATPDLDGPLSIRAQIKELALGTLKGDALLLEVEGSGRQHETRLSLAGPRLALKTRLTGGLQSLDQWQGRIEDLEVSHPRAVRLETPTTLSVSKGRLDVGAARLTSSGAHFDLAHLTLAPGTVTTQGKFSGVPLALLNLFEADSGIQTTLRLGGEWRIDAAQSLNGFLRVRRESGTILVGSYSPAESGLSDAWLNLTADNDELRGEGRLVAPRGALVRATFGVRAAKDGAGWIVPAAAPVALELEANLPYLDWLGPFIHPSLVIQGNARATIQGRGTYGNPLLEGRIEGAELAVSEPASGVRLTRGTLQARILEERLVLDAFQMRGKEGVLTATGEGTLRGERRLQLAFQARQLGVLDRPNWDVNADADGALIADGRGARLEARVKVNRAQVGLPEQGAPALSEDVVVKGRTRQTAAQQKSRVALDVTVDLGNAFRVLTIEHAKILKQALPIYESKLDAKLGGILRIRSDPTGAPLATGNIRVVEGVYTFLGKRLEIQRGTFRFDGPLGNPALDILAMNEQLAVKVGVSVTGTARNARVTLVSDPEVPEQEKLSWLLFGHGGQPVDASLSGKATAGSGVALFGFQLSEKLFVGYEQGAAGAGNVMTLYSKLTDRLSVEARTGDQTGLRLFYTYELKR